LSRAVAAEVALADAEGALVGLRYRCMQVGVSDMPFSTVQYRYGGHTLNLSTSQRAKDTLWWPYGLSLGVPQSLRLKAVKVTRESSQYLLYLATASSGVRRIVEG
jgi:hypothetical protein